MGKGRERVGLFELPSLVKGGDGKGIVIFFGFVLSLEKYF